MFQLSNGHQIEFVAASGALAYDGQGWPWEWPLRRLGLFEPSLFTPVMKTITFLPRLGNFRWYKPWGCIRFIWEGCRIVGTVNAFGLTNPGSIWWCEKVGPNLRASLIGSILSDDPNDENMVTQLVMMARELAQFGLIVAVELNFGCPNTDRAVLESSRRVIMACKAVAERVPGLPRILKLSVFHDVNVIVPAVEQYVEAFSINSVPWSLVFPDKKSPLAHLGGGGVSGLAAQPFTWPLAEKIQALTSRPVIWPSMWNYPDIAKARSRGAKAHSFGAVFLPFPWRPTLFVRKDKRERR